MLQSIYVPIVRAIASLYAQGRVVHADLNPSNIILQIHELEVEVALSGALISPISQLILDDHPANAR